jgi:hypothetical protein
MRKTVCSQNTVVGLVAEELLEALEEPSEPGKEK